MPVVWFLWAVLFKVIAIVLFFFVDSVDDCNHSYDCRFIALLCLANLW